MTDHHGYSDLPAPNDELGFAPSAEALAAIMQEGQLADTPLTVGVYGEWGSGKTTLMQMILKRLDDSASVTVWFDAWRYAQQDALWRALLLSVVEALRDQLEHDTALLTAYIGRKQRIAGTAFHPSAGEQELDTAREQLKKRLDDLADSLYRSVERDEPGEIQFQWDKAGKLATDAVIRAGFNYIPVLGQINEAVVKAREAAGGENYGDKLLELFQRQSTRLYREQVRSLEQFHQGLEQLVKELITDLDRRLVVFIDDLDRCLPEQAISVLEAIKAFLHIQGCVFVLGIDREIIERGIRVRYKEFALAGASAPGPFPVAERDYLEKIVQVPFRLPPLAPQTVRRFLNSRLPSVGGLSAEESRQVADLMTAGLQRNPRKVKRSFNIFRLHLTLDRAQKRQTPAGLIAKLTVIQTSFADLYEKIARDPTLLRTFEAIARGVSIGAPITQEQRDELGRQDQRLREMLHQTPWYEQLTDEELRDLVYQSRVTDEK
ncbi:MAG TPA: P-loop NTPase fold protein [Roseiflexaceae bacterium]|nr:P-loop NTPase fold protein [Roseiflexaceae bacterium]